MNDFEIQNFYEFFKKINGNMVYSVSPMISIKGNPNEPYTVLSKSILITKYSDCRLIQFYLYNKYQQFLKDFGVNYLDKYKLVFKFKKVRFDIDQINRKFKGE
jgi:hypothetical protein